MPNPSILAAFDRMWQHIIATLSNKADINHTHDEYATNTYVDENFALKSEIENIDLSAYETKNDAQLKLDAAKAYTDEAVANLSSDSHNHDDRYYTESEIDGQIGVLNDEITQVRSDMASQDIAALANAQAYTDAAVAEKSQVQIITWEVDD